MSSHSLLAVLTEDLLIRVNEKLADNSSRKAWRLVCKDFYRVESLTRRTLRVLRVEYLVALLRNYTNVHTLDLSVCPRVDDGTVSMVLGGGGGGGEPLCWTKNLKSLNLSRATGLGSSGLEMVVKACRELERIEVSYCCQFGDREAAAVSFGGGLREVRMDKCLEVTDVGLANIAVGCAWLEKLSLKWCMEITDLGIDLLCKKCKELKFLDVSYLKVTNESLRSIATLPKLEVLAMVGSPLVTDVGLQYLGNGCPSLQELDVSRCGCVSSSGLISLIRNHAALKRIDAGYCFLELSSVFLYHMEHLKNLNTIVIGGARVSDVFFQTISTNCKNLTEIGLSKCIGVTNMGIMQLVSGCANLKTLDLTCCHSVTDAAVSAIADSCRNLVCLKLESCNMITEKSLQQLGSFCLLLEELDLTDCGGVSDNGLKYLSRCSALLCLKLGLCTNISGKGLSYIASSCSKLLQLDLYRCIGIGDDGLASLLSGCKKLKRLNLSYCNGVTDRGMEFLGHMEELSDLELRGLDRITGLGLTAFVARNKNLTYLDLKHCKKIDDSGFLALAFYSRNLRQINLSYCAVSDMALCMLMGNLTRLQDVDLVQLTNVTVNGIELVLMACSVRIKKVKLSAAFSCLLSSEILEILHRRGCKIRWD